MEGEWKCSALVQKIRRVVLRSLYTPSSTLLSILISVSIFVSCHKKLLNRNDFTLRSDVINLQVYRFITYAFFHKDLNALLCNIFILWHFGSGLERSIGTVKHLYLTTMFTILSGLLYLLLNLVLFGPGKVEDVSGLTSVTFAMMGLSTARTRMRRSLFFGINIPTAFVPWVLLFAAFVIPGASFMVCIGGIIVGQASHILVAEEIAWRNLHPRVTAGETSCSGPKSVGDRKFSISTPPPPGSYPTQNYAFCPIPVAQHQYPNTQAYDTWQNYSYSYGNFQQFGHQYSWRPSQGHKSGIEHCVQPGQNYFDSSVASTRCYNKPGSNTIDTQKCSVPHPPQVQNIQPQGSYVCCTPNNELGVEGSFMVGYAATPVGALGGGHGGPGLRY
nr:PREDICTED: rhomboid domain-containing protein 2 isoform X2 [Latimeria chalumnae]|eukprot:XP_014353129.1 PREDICTED: rhomboid domain-containing protein 2 isoform X2 [Latimeria chalumnae]